MKKNKEKCPQTMSGKHIFREVFDGFSDVKTVGITPIGVSKTLIKCIACGLINDLEDSHE